ncbi:molecular chaperone [Fusarium beomiforme]|uniref:Molecular chaperone n=1 Tax=Fusarium beomiforme TaxID=44412 RepID=A0A9P5ANK3_9HYPO|nr:molecular chaperone [Fusarium beomiforme]
MAFIDYYAILGLPPAANRDEIKKAYRQLAKKTHPDKNQEDEDATANFQKLNDAYSILSDPNKRRTYDTTYQQQHRTYTHRNYSSNPSFNAQRQTYTQNATRSNTPKPKNAGPEIFVTPSWETPSMRQLRMRVEAADSSIRISSSWVSRDKRNIRITKRNIMATEVLLNSLKEEMMQDEYEKAKKFGYEYFKNPQIYNLCEEGDPKIEAKKRRLLALKADLQAYQEELGSLEKKLGDYRVTLSGRSTERAMAASRYNWEYRAEEQKRQHEQYFSAGATQDKERKKGPDDEGRDTFEQEKGFFPEFRRENFDFLRWMHQFNQSAGNSAHEFQQKKSQGEDVGQNANES